MADLAVRHQDGRLPVSGFDTRDFLQATLTGNVRAGTGLQLVDNMVSASLDLVQTKRAAQFAQRYAGEFIAGFLTPLRTLTDARCRAGRGPGIPVTHSAAAPEPRRIPAG